MALPTPEPGLVIHFSYLWADEHRQGAEEGRKARPCVVVLAAQHERDGWRVTVAPITHSAPRDGQISVEIPLRVKQHLGLDDARSWIVAEETNHFIWPGFDLRPISGRSGAFAYGFLPPKLFQQLIEAFERQWRRGRAAAVPR